MDLHGRKNLDAYFYQKNISSFVVFAVSVLDVIVTADTLLESFMSPKTFFSL